MRSKRSRPGAKPTILLGLSHGPGLQGVDEFGAGQQLVTPGDGALPGCGAEQRLQVERCDGQPSGPLAASDVAAVFKPAGAPAGKPRGERLRPTAQMKLL